MEPDARVMHIVECTIPADMSIREWRGRHSPASAPSCAWLSRVAAAVRHLVPWRTPRCDHLHDTTTRYDHAAKRLDFFLVCPVCGTEKRIQSVPYEPRFERMGASVHALRRPRAIPGRERRAA
jgi:hypothetical protein